jgi:hypothetical protein
MSRKILTVILLAGLGTPLSLLGQDNRPEDHWVPFEQIEAEGSVDLSGLGPSERHLYSGMVDRARASVTEKRTNQLGRSCDSEIIHEFDPAVYPMSTFRAQLEEAAYVLVGEIVSADQGFFYNTPGMALGIRVQETLKAPAQSSLPDVVRFFYPWAEFQVSGVKICARGGYHDDQEPQVGQQALLALMNVTPVDTGQAPAGFMLEEEIVFTLPTGGVAVPHSFRADADLIPEDDFDDLTSWIRESLVPAWTNE